MSVCVCVCELPAYFHISSIGMHISANYTTEVILTKKYFFTIFLKNPSKMEFQEKEPLKYS